MFEDREAAECRTSRHHVLLSCLPKGSSHLADAIRLRGSIPVLIGSDAVMELSAQDVVDNWTFAQALPPKRVSGLTVRLGHDLDLAIADVDESLMCHAEEAAAFLFLALRHSHGDMERALEGCRISWDGPASIEQVEYLV